MNAFNFSLSLAVQKPDHTGDQYYSVVKPWPRKRLSG